MTELFTSKDLGEISPNLTLASSVNSRAKKLGIKYQHNGKSATFTREQAQEILYDDYKLKVRWKRIKAIELYLNRYPVSEIVLQCKMATPYVLEEIKTYEQNDYVVVESKLNYMLPIQNYSLHLQNNNSL